MKKLFYLFLLVSSFGFAQDYPKEGVEFIVGKELKVMPGSPEVQKKGYSNFYKTKDFKRQLVTRYATYNGAIFKLVSFEKYKFGADNKTMIKLELADAKAKTVYYNYDPSSRESFIFEIIGGIQYPDGYWCKDINKKLDKTKTITTYYTPFNNLVYFTKEKDVYAACIKGQGKVMVIGKKGVLITLKDGTKIAKPEAKIEMKSTGEGLYTYEAKFPLTKEEVGKLDSSYITEYRLATDNYTLEDGSLYQEYLKCLIKQQ
ncbi:MAG: hypothetical protein V4548_13585 [Bacteroidota bacterium]